MITVVRVRISYRTLNFDDSAASFCSIDGCWTSAFGAGFGFRSAGVSSAFIESAMRFAFGSAFRTATYMEISLMCSTMGHPWYWWRSG